MIDHDPDAIFLWDLDEDKDEEDVKPKEKDISIEVIYRAAENTANSKQGKGMTQTFIILLGAIIVVILIVLIIVCCYNRIAIQVNIEKTAERSHQQQDGKLERRMSLQYDAK